MNSSVDKQNCWNWQNTQKILCPLCGSDQHKSIYLRSDYLDIVVCNSCSFRFVQPQPTEAELIRFYEQGYFSGNHDFHQNTNYFEARKKAIEREEVTGWQFTKQNANLSNSEFLDLGCADGALLVLAQLYNATKVTGVEFSAAAADYGRNHYGLEIVESSADKLLFSEQSFDIVTAFDLIEHVQNPSQLFEEVSRVLRSGGLFLGGCPDMKCFDDWGTEWTGVQRNMEHLSYFDSEALSRLANQSGFKIVLFEYQGFPLNHKQYKNTQTLKPLSLLSKFLQPDIWSYNLLQKLRVKFKRSKHFNELMFVLQKL